GRHPRSEREAIRPLLEHGHVLLERDPRRILGAGVLEALVLPEPLLDVGRGLVDGDRHGPRRGIGLLPGVDGVGRKAHQALMYSMRSKRVSMPVGRPVSSTASAAFRSARSFITRGSRSWSDTVGRDFSIRYSRRDSGLAVPSRTFCIKAPSVTAPTTFPSLSTGSCEMLNSRIRASAREAGSS